ncbi:ankyrin repeat domain-containing protein [Candidatus Dependentiae bacterium]|nr:ankyrin repeat domain-containing protein [Candidatus Dependentiae bacterium]
MKKLLLLLFLSSSFISLVNAANRTNKHKKGKKHSVIQLKSEIITPEVKIVIKSIFDFIDQDLPVELLREFLTIDQSFDFNVRNAVGFTPLQQAVLKKKLPFVELLCSKATPDVVNAQSANGITALHIAAKHNNLLVIALLLQAGASKTIKNSANQIPFDLAASYEAQALLQPSISLIQQPENRLVVYQPKQSLLTSINTTGAHNVSKEDLTKEITLNMDAQNASHSVTIINPEELLFQAARENSAEHLAHAFKSTYISPNGIDSTTGLTLLQTAVMYHSEACVLFLCTNPETIINAQNKEGNTALHIAAENNNTTIITYLRLAGALTHILNSFDQSAYDLATTAEAQNLLEKSFATLVTEYATQYQQLLDARWGSLDIIQVVLTGDIAALMSDVKQDANDDSDTLIIGINLPHTSLARNTLLHLAAMLNSIESIQALLQYQSIDRAAKNNEGFTAYDVAASEAIKQILVPKSQPEKTIHDSCIIS